MSSGSATATPVGPGPTPAESVATASITPLPTSSPLRATDDQAALLLIAPEDLPTGYQVDPEIGPGRWVDLPPGCAPLDAFGRTLVTAPVRAARGFVGGSTGPFVRERVAVLPGAAADALARLGEAAPRCSTYHSRDPDGTTVRFTVSRAASGQYGDQTVALTVTGSSVGSGTLVSMLAVIRRGDTVIALVHAGLGRLDREVMTTAAAAVQAAIARL